MRSLSVAFLLGVFLCASGTAHAQRVPRLLSVDNLTKLSPHVWMIKGSPNVAIVVGTRATLVVGREVWGSSIKSMSN